MQPVGTYLAELNIGRLVAPTDDPRVAEFMGALDRINGMGKRMPGFVWMMEGSGEPGIGNTENHIGNDPQFVANLTVWEDVQSLEHFVFNTVHKQFYDRRAEWFELMADQHFVMWFVEEGHKPTLAEAMERLAYKQEHGDSDHAFGWSYLKQATLFMTKSCRPAQGVSL
jgi:Domain of unknown function (DUF3291).